MSKMKAQGNLIGNPVMIADGVYVSLVNCETITFLCYLAGAAGDTYTLTEAKTAAGGSSKVLACITQYHTSDGVGGAQTKQTQAAGSTVVTTAVTAQNGMVVEVGADQLDDGFKFIKLTSTGAGLVTAVPTYLDVQRTPANLPSYIA